MLVPAEAHQYGGTWVFYVLVPLILCGVVASLWLIVRGAIGILGSTPRGERLSIPSTTAPSSRAAAAKRNRTLKGGTPQGEGAAPPLLR